MGLLLRLAATLFVVASVAVPVRAEEVTPTPTPTPTPLSNDASLEALIPSVGTLAPAFDPETFEYTLTVNVDLLDLDYAAAAGARVRCYVDDGRASCYEIGLLAGATVVVELRVTAEDTTTTRTYTVTVTRPPAPTPTPTPTPKPTPRPIPTPTPGESLLPSLSPSPSPVVLPSLPPSSGPSTPPATGSFVLAAPVIPRTGRVAIETGGFLPGSRVEAWLERPPLYLGALEASATGVVAGELRLPTGALDGETAVRLSGFAPNGDPLILVAPLRIGPLAPQPSSGSPLLLVGLAALALAGAVAGLAAYRRANAPREKLPWEQ